MPEYRRLRVRDCQGTLWAFYCEYKDRALASFEGDLSKLNLNELPEASLDETLVLKRQTIEPEFDFIVLPFNERTISILKKRLAAGGVLGRDGSVIHTQISVEDELIFIACDNFHDDCTVASMSVPEQLLKAMKTHGLLRAYGDA